jgi:hypothetical protein
LDKVIVDTNIFAAIFGGNAALKARIDQLEKAVNTIIYLELIQGSKAKVKFSASKPIYKTSDSSTVMPMIHNALLSWSEPIQEATDCCSQMP